MAEQTDSAAPCVQKIAVAGRGPEFEKLVELLRDGVKVEVAAELRLVAAACEGGPLPEIAARHPDLPLYADVGELLGSHRDTDVLFVSGSRALVERARALAPASTLVFGPAESVFFLTLFDPERLCLSCRLDLSRTRSLFEAVMDEVREDMILMDRDGYIVDVNRNVWERRGKTREEFLGKPVWEAFEGRDQLCREREDDCPALRTLSSGQKAEGMHTFVDQEGRLHYYRVATYPILDASGRMTHVAELRRDVTQRTRMEQRLQQSERLASIGELSTYLAHEIRNPLFAISGFANSLARNENLDEQAREKANIILQESKRLDVILKSILNFARPTEGAAGRVDVNEVVRETMGVMTLDCEKLCIVPEMELDEGIPLAKGDPELLKQSLINLVKNAKEAMPRGGRLVIRTGLKKNRVFLQVEDTGTGIPKENLPKIFNPFFSTKDKGAGLGLAMIKKILDDIGGDVTIDSVEGKGTKVTLAMPPVLGGEEAGKRRARDDEPQAAEPLGPPKVGP